jgi:proline dehydrogenase
METIRTRLREWPARILRVALIWISRRRALGRMATRLPITRRMVARFVAGETLEEAMAVCERLREAGMRTTVDVLGESVASSAQAEAAADRYIATLEALVKRGLDGNVSLKPSQMGMLLDPDLCRADIARVAVTAQRHVAFVRVDMEDHGLTEPTLALVRVLRARPDVASSSSHLRRSAADQAADRRGHAVAAVQGRPMTTRPESPSCGQRSDGSYVALMSCYRW